MGRGWVQAGRLSPGQQVRQTDGSAGEIATTHTEPHPEGITVFNFQVKDYHTYFVAQSGRDRPVLVHNSCDEYTRLYRAVEPEELADIRRFGDYNISNISTYKRFYENADDMNRFVAAQPGRNFTRTYIDVPTEYANRMHRMPIGGEGMVRGIDVYENPDFY